MDRPRPSHVRAICQGFARPQPMAPLHAVHRRLGGEVQPLVGELRYELLRRETRIPRAREYAHDLCLLDGGERVMRSMTRSTSTIVSNGLRTPTLNGSCRDADHTAARSPSSA